jgi:predicted nucleic acid-binding protein
MNNIIIDTGYWYALFDARDEYHIEANELADYLELGNILIPYPTLYESINTRFSKRPEWMEEFKKIIERDNVTLIDDADYKESALNLTFETTLLQNRPISLVDTIIRIMLDDKNLKIDYLLSFNIGDFFDICQKRRIEFINK